MSDCHIEAITKTFDPEALDSAWVAYLAVQGIGCPRCVIRVSNSLLSLEGVLICIFEECTAAVAYDPKLVTPHDLLEAVAVAGNDGHHHYQATVWFNSPLSNALGSY